MTFFSDPNLEPKRSFRFLVSINGNNPENGIMNFMVKSANKPKKEISQSDHQFLNHTFKFPGKSSWKDITISVLDAIDPDASSRFMAIIEESGYKAPVGSSISPGDEIAQTVSKKRAVNALGKVTITQLDADGNDVEAWVLHNAWIKDFDPGDLDYGSEDLLNATVIIAYDWAHVETAGRQSRPSNQIGAGSALVNPPST